MPVIDNYEAFGVLIAQINRSWRRALDQYLLPFGLTEATWRPLIYISRAHQPLSQNELADLLSLDRSSIVRILDALESSGMVMRQEDPNDRRVKRLSLTSKGEKVAAQVENVSKQLSDKVFSAIPKNLLANTKTGLLEVQRLLEEAKETAGKIS